MTTPADFVEAFPAEPLYAEPGWIAVCRTADDTVLLVRSSKLYECDDEYETAMTCTEGLHRISLETVEAPDWVGGEATYEIWSPRLEDLL